MTFISGLASQRLQQRALLKKAFIRSISSNGTITVPFVKECKLHRMDAGPPSEAVTSRYDGQEAVATGVDADAIAGRFYAGELSSRYLPSYLATLQESESQTKGKGGSMHMYSKEHNFFGGAGIVGAQVPNGAGLAFAAKYKCPSGEPTPVAMALYGDGAANQGQIWESANMASLWKLPMIFCIENNQYGMGTSKDRSSSNNDYYTMGNHIPGFKTDGMNILAVREAIKFAKEWCSKGNGPIFVEVDTYRYHGHSMSDPGTTYRNREEVASMRTARDPIEYVKNLMVDTKLSDYDELKAIEKDIRTNVQDSLKRAKAAPKLAAEELFTNVFTNSESLKYIRIPEGYVGSIE